MPNLVAFLAYTLLTAFTPGPNNIIAMSSTSRYGLKKSMRLILGIYIGFLVVLVLCSTFSVMLVNFIPRIKPVLAYVGAVYILWLAWHIVKSKPHEQYQTNDKANGFITGFILQFVNVKIIIYGVTAISTFVTPYYHSLGSIIGFTLLLTLFGCAGTFCWAIFGVIFEKVFSKYYTVLNIIMALLLVYCAITLII
ncbi:MAG: cysteine/O-acetylserine transporter [Firmicutes bacterium HGW-Firmicutes-7]|nr:MAG: cysteine/O-acetylserine transporter [Firmicutes bacterium HGW-Firmicutes-7]